MAALDFPSSPATNQTYTVGDTTWVYNGTVWKVQTTTAVSEANANASSLYLYQTIGGL